MRKIYDKMLALGAAVAALASCIYPFDAASDLSEGSSLLVVESDIMVGDYTYVKLSNVMSLSGVYSTRTPLGTAWVEDDAGKRYDDVNGSLESYYFMIDTRSAKESGKYRLCVKVNGKDYHTDWLTPNPAPVFDDLTYSVDGEDAVISLSTHSDDGAQFFRWSYEETWKFHPEYVRTLTFNSEKKEIEELEEPDYSKYWCWQDHSSTEIELCATTDLNTNALVDHSFLKIPRSSQKFMTRYRIKVNVRTISAEAYRFLYTLKVNSNFVGSLFSPNPSDVRGNIHCEQNPDEYVVGYVDCCVQSVSKTLYIDSKEVYSKPVSQEFLFFPQPEEEQSMPDCYLEHWMQGNVPVVNGTLDGVSGVLWGLRRCIDCTKMGGYQQEPSDWLE